MESVRGSDQKDAMSKVYQGKVGLIQRVKPNYRVPFFDELASRCEDGFYLVAGQPLDIESIPDEAGLSVGQFSKLKNTYFKDPSHPAFLCYQGGLMEWLVKTDPDVLIVEANLRYLSSNAAIHWMKKRGRPVIGWGLGAKAAQGLIASARHRFLRQFDALIAYSSIGAEEYARTGAKPENIFVAKNAVISAPRNKVERVPVLGRRITILFVGRLQPRKNVDQLIKAVSALSGEDQPRLRVVGDGPEMENLKRLANQVLPETIFTGHLEGAALEREFVNADLFVLPGTGGLAVQQAISYGLPVIVERGDGTQADLVTPENGWLLENGNVKELTSVLINAMGSTDRFASMGQRSFEIARDEVNIQSMADVFVNAMELVGSKRSS